MVPVLTSDSSPRPVHPPWLSTRGDELADVGLHLVHTPRPVHLPGSLLLAFAIADYKHDRGIDWPGSANQ